jgi:hypothetical protein
VFFRFLSHKRLYSNDLNFKSNIQCHLTSVFVWWTVGQTFSKLKGCNQSNYIGFEWFGILRKKALKQECLDFLKERFDIRVTDKMEVNIIFQVSLFHTCHFSRIVRESPRFRHCLQDVRKSSKTPRNSIFRFRVYAS